MLRNNSHKANMGHYAPYVSFITSMSATLTHIDHGIPVRPSEALSFSSTINRNKSTGRSWQMHVNWRHHILNLAILLGDFGLGAAMAMILNWLALIPFRHSKGKHWTERARRLYPARVNAGWNVWLIPVIIVLGQRLLVLEGDFWWLPVAFVSWLGALAGGYFFAREVFPAMTPREWFHETLVV